MVDLQHISREINSLNGRLAADLRRRIQQPASAEVNQGLLHARGARVVDLVTGEEGVILGGNTEHIIVPTA